ncbi:MAG TPA: VanW family protein, partial [Candidatus Limnocylindria bacterium]
MRRIAIVGLILAAAAGLAWAGASAGDHIVPGVRAAGIDIGGLSLATARDRLQTQAAVFGAAPFVVAGAGTEWQSTNAELGVSLDVDRAVANALAVGRSGDPLVRARSILSAATGGVDLGWPRRSVDDRLGAFIDRIVDATGRPAVDGDITIGAAGVTVREPEMGVAVDRMRLEADLALQRGTDTTVALHIASIVPALGEEQIAAAREEALDAFAPLRVTAGSESLVIPASRIAELVRIVRSTGGPDRLIAIVDDSAVAVLVDEIAPRLDGPARSAVLVPGRERLVVTPGRDGVSVDRVLARAALAAAVLAPSDGERILNVPAAIVEPGLATKDAATIAASTDLLGGFTTYFPENFERATNIGLAARRFDGMVIAAGASFSFWDRIGEVSPRTGYLSAGAIIGGISSSAIGGGLCQVSTTLFNAVARAGLRLDERHPHDYYIERYPLGLDAAVFAPFVDLQWTNDTAGAITIRAQATPTSVTFWLYGPPTGRTVVFLDPVQWNVRYPAA